MKVTKHAVWGWMLLIFILSVSNPSKLPSPNIIGIDKLGHLFFYFILTLLLIYRLADWSIFRKNKLSYSAMIAIGYGILIEFIQLTFCPGRYFDFSDILANIIGVLVGIAFVYYYQQKF